MKYIIIGFAALLSFLLPVLAAEGPQVPVCEGCFESTELPYPRSGFWFDPERSGSGFTIQVENGVLAGAYYGYESDGARTWYTFSGKLLRSEEKGVYWQLEADLNQFSGGDCIDCAYRKPSAPVALKKLKLKVLRRGFISYQLDDGEVLHVTPLVFGTAMNNHFPALGDADLPDTADAFAEESHPVWAKNHVPWLITRKKANRSKLGAYLTLERGLVWGSSAFVKPESLYHMLFINWLDDNPEPAETRGQFMCGLIDHFPKFTISDEYRARFKGQTMCVMGGNLLGGEVRYFTAPLGDVGDNYFRFVADDGTILEGHRLMYQ